MAVLEAAVERAAGGAGAVVLIGAEAGMGKSRLVAELAAGATRAGATAVLKATRSSPRSCWRQSTKTSWDDLGRKRPSGGTAGASVLLSDWGRRSCGGTP